MLKDAYIPALKDGVLRANRIKPSPSRVLAKNGIDNVGYVWYVSIHGDGK